MAPLALASKPRLAARSARVSTVKVQALSDANVIIGSSTIALLALGRFVFLPYHRRSLQKAGVPAQNGKSYFQAGDRLAEEAPFVVNTNDPAGFTIVDTAAWGALGHALGFAALVLSK